MIRKVVDAAIILIGSSQNQVEERITTVEGYFIFILFRNYVELFKFYQNINEYMILNLPLLQLLKKEIMA